MMMRNSFLISAVFSVWCGHTLAQETPGIDLHTQEMAEEIQNGNNWTFVLEEICTLFLTGNMHADLAIIGMVIIFVVMGGWLLIIGADSDDFDRFGFVLVRVGFMIVLLNFVQFFFEQFFPGSDSADCLDSIFDPGPNYFSSPAPLSHHQSGLRPHKPS